MTLTASLEDNSSGDNPAVAGYISFDTGSFLLNASAIWEQDDTTSANGVAYNDTEDNWMVGVGAIAHLGDMIRVEAAANKGNGYTPGIYGTSNGGHAATTTVAAISGENDMGYWSASVLAVLSLASNMSLEVDAGYSNLDHESDELSTTVFSDQVDKLWSVGGALYWDPVDQLTLGWGAGWNKQSDNDGTDHSNVTAGFGAWFRF